MTTVNSTTEKEASPALHETFISPREIATEMRAKLSQFRQDLNRVLQNSDMKVAIPPSCSEKLTKRIDRHNSSCNKFSAAWDNLEADVERLVFAMAESGVTGENIASQAANIRCGKYDLLQRWVGLLAAEQVILGDVIDGLKPTIAATEETLEKEKDTIRKKLRDAGITPESLPQAKRGSLAAAEIAFENMHLKSATSVQTIYKKLHNFKAQLSEAVNKHARIESDAAKIGKEVIVSWRLIVMRSAVGTL